MYPRKMRKIDKETPVSESLLNKVTYCRSASLLKRYFWRYLYYLFCQSIFRLVFLLLWINFWRKIMKLGNQVICTKSRTSCSEVFYLRRVLKNYAKFTGQHLCPSFVFNKSYRLKGYRVIKKTLKQIFSCKFYEIFKNTYSVKHFWTAASVSHLNTSARAIHSNFIIWFFEKLFKCKYCLTFVF